MFTRACIYIYIHIHIYIIYIYIIYIYIIYIYIFALKGWHCTFTAAQPKISQDVVLKRLTKQNQKTANTTTHPQAEEQKQQRNNHQKRQTKAPHSQRREWGEHLKLYKQR